MIATAAHAGHAPPTVAISVYAYAPQSIGVVEGDIVQWNWDGPDTNHSVTSDAGSGESFDSGVKNKSGATFTYYFGKAGTYQYHCTVHANMTGEVVVAPGTQYDKTAPKVTGVKLVKASKRSATVGFRIDENGSVATKVRRRGSSKVLRQSFTFVSAGAAQTKVRMSGLRKGRYVIAVRAQDATGNQSPVKTVRVTR